jgi:hypothetical protein
VAGRVIQGFFVGRHPRVAAHIAQLPLVHGQAVQPKAAPRPPGPPAPAFAGRPSVAQAKALPGPPAPAFATRPPTVQARGANDSFQVDPGRLGLMSGGGRPLPDAVRSQMEAALGADFSAVRVHVGPQAERIGAVAFTIGNDLYFAPGRFQPDTIQGKQLLGHELAHVVQQHQGRVRNLVGSGVAVVQDHALEAEADRLGIRAAQYRQAKMVDAVLARHAGHRDPATGLVSGSHSTARSTFTAVQRRATSSSPVIQRMPVSEFVIEHYQGIQISGHFRIEYVTWTNYEPGCAIQFGMDFVLTHAQNKPLCQLIYPITSVAQNQSGQWNIDRSLRGNDSPNLDTLIFRNARHHVATATTVDGLRDIGNVPYMFYISRRP